MRSAGVLDDAPVTSVPPVVPLTAPGGRSGAKPTGTRLASRRVRRNRFVAAATVVALGILLAFTLDGGAPAASHVAVPRPHLRDGANPRLNADWDGDGRPFTLVFGGDVNFPAGSVLGSRLAQDPATALGPGAHALLAHSSLVMVNFESALTFGGGARCPSPRSTSSPHRRRALTAFRAAGATLVTEANNHGEDCGQPGLLQALTIRARAHYRVIGIGANARAGVHLVPDRASTGSTSGSSRRPR